MTTPPLHNRKEHTMTTRTGVLVGKYFHTTTVCPGGERIPEWQGHIVGEPSPELLLVELFEWLMGEPDGQHLITLTDFAAKKPVLYDDAEDMHYAYEYGSMSHRCERRDCHRQDTHA